MKSIKKRMVTLLLSAIFVASIGTISTQANNHTDTAFTFNFNNNGAKTTSRRQKTDATSMYMKCTSMNSSYSYTVHANGHKTSGGTGYNCANGYTYTFKNGTERFIINYVKEWGYGYASLVATPNYARTYTAKGLWSPDSV